LFSVHLLIRIGGWILELN